MEEKKKRSLLFINQYYYPDRASTGQLLTELCEWLTNSFEITALVGTPSYSAKKAESKNTKIKGIINGVNVIRAYNTKFSRHSLLGRLLNYVSFMISASIRALFQKKHDIIVTMTDPPTVNFIGYLIKKSKGGKLVQVCKDIYPEIAIVVQRADNPIIVKTFSFMNRIAQNACDYIYCISQGMKQRLVNKDIDPNKISVIHDWIDTDLITPQSKHNPFARKNGITDKFVVMHSGNIGLSQNLKLLIETAQILKADKDIIFIFIGEGAEKDNLIRMSEEKNLDNVKFLPYQDKEYLKYSLSSGDVHFVSLKRGLSGLIVPSKIYGIMAAARPVIACLEKNDDICKLIEEVRFGINVEEEDPNSIAKEILYFYNNRDLLKDLGDRGRKAVVKRNSKEVILNSYKEFFSKISIN